VREQARHDPGERQFVLSPESAVSPICAWELDDAIKLGKRILPLIARPHVARQHKPSAHVAKPS
jgi:hypothetical protein